MLIKGSGDKMNKDNKISKFSTLKEVVEALKRIDKYAGLYLWGNFDEEDFQNGTKDFINISEVAGNPRKYYKDPLDFFQWSLHEEFDWYLLNKQLKQSDTVKINLEDYITKDIDFTGCDPVIAEAIKKNKSILCKVKDEGEFLVQQHNVVSYHKGKAFPYVTTGHNVYKYAEPIQKTKTELRVKDPVKVMQYLVDNGYVVDKSGFFQKESERYCPRSLFAYCGCLAPEGWPLPELLKEVAVKCEHEDEDGEPHDPFEMDDPNPFRDVK